MTRADLFLGNAGTAFRPLTAALALAGGHYTLSGVPRMHERPIADLVEGLRMLGAHIRYAGVEGYPPLAIEPPDEGLHAGLHAGLSIGLHAGSPPGLHAGSQTLGAPLEASVRGSVSSQFLTALLLAAPLVPRGVIVRVVGELISKPYVEMTLNLMRRFGVHVQREGWNRFTVPAGAAYQSPGRILVEGDASSASYFLAAGALGRGPVRVTGVGRDSIQGDIRFTEVLAQMGATVHVGDDWIETCGVDAAAGERLNAIDADLNHIPDAAMTVAVLALFARGVSTLRGIHSWRVKETDRIAAMTAELTKVGASIEADDGSLRITPPERAKSATIDTYDDHRMAMCLSLASLGGVAMRINDPQCVAKTFPTYFDVFEKLLSH